MLAYVRKFTYLSAAKNSNKEYLTYGKGKQKSEKTTPFGGIYYASKAFYALSLDKVIGRHSYCSQFYLQRLPVGRDNVSHVWRVPSVAVTAWKMSTAMGKGALCPNLNVFGRFIVQICVCAR